VYVVSDCDMRARNLAGHTAHLLLELLLSTKCGLAGSLYAMMWVVGEWATKGRVGKGTGECLRSSRGSLAACRAWASSDRTVESAAFCLVVGRVCVPGEGRGGMDVCQHPGGADGVLLRPTLNAWRICHGCRSA
jgi:hypothetical protein